MLKQGAGKNHPQKIDTSYGDTFSFVGICFELFLMRFLFDPQFSKVVKCTVSCTYLTESLYEGAQLVLLEISWVSVDILYPRIFARECFGQSLVVVVRFYL